MRSPPTRERTSTSIRSAVGNQRHIVVSEQSGRSNVIERARELGLEVDPASPAAKAVAARIKELEDQGFQFEDAETSSSCSAPRAEMTARRSRRSPTPATPRKGKDDDGSSSTASGRGRRRRRGATRRGDGVGPVNAIEQVVRRALVPAYPYRARVTRPTSRHDRPHRRGDERSDPCPSHRNRAGVEPWTTDRSSSDLLDSAWPGDLRPSETRS